MKTIKLKNVQIKEIIIRPNEDIPMVIFYDILDDKDKVFMTKQTQITKEDFSSKGKGAITSFAAELVIKIKQAEQI